MSAPIRTAMVFAAGLGTRMRPLTETLPKPLIEVANKPLIDHMLDRLDEAGIETAVVNVHYFADQVEARLAGRRRPRLAISDERALLLDQGGGIKKALPLIGKAPFVICNTDSIWIEGPRSNLRRLIEGFDPDHMDVLLLVASATTSIGVDWPGDFTMLPNGRLLKREERCVAPFVYAGVGIVKPQLFANIGPEVFKLAPFFFAAAERGRLFGQRLDGIWLHVGTPQVLPEAELSIARSIL
jgi:MurNAc alpha-1-phosphate uridylyltransferase